MRSAHIYQHPFNTIIRIANFLKALIDILVYYLQSVAGEPDKNIVTPILEHIQAVLDS